MTIEPNPGTLPPPGASSRRVLLTAGGIADGRGRRRAPGALLLDLTPASGPEPWLPPGCLWCNATVVACGTPAEVRHHRLADGAVRVDLPREVLVPGTVNAHAHLDLTHVGPRAYDRQSGFSAWLDTVRRSRALDAEAIGASVRTGARMMLSGGVVAVGDIAGAPRGSPSLAPFHELSRSALRGVSYLEFFAIGCGEDRGMQGAARVLEGMESLGSKGVRVGLQPHAPVSVSPRAYRWACDRAAESGMPLATHLAETVEEREFISAGRGPQRDFLEGLGLWDEHAAASVGLGRSPVMHLRDCLERARFLLAHVNDASDEDLAVLSATGQSVAYCPRASEYFGNPSRLGPHRYRGMIERGINVALGTDSIINLPPAPGGSAMVAVSILDEMKRLYERDATDPALLLRMGTVNGARALGLQESAFVFDDGAWLAGLVAVEVPESVIADPSRAILDASTRVRTLLVGNSL